MSEVLRSLQRQVLADSVSLPKNSAFSTLQSGFNLLSQAGATAATSVATLGAKQAGAAFAEGGAGPTKLSPPITKATAAYNEAFLNTQANIAVSEASKNLTMQRLDMQSPQKLNSNSLAEYSKVALDGIIRGTLEGINPEIRSEVGQRLNDVLFKNQVSLTSSVQAFNLAQNKKQFEEVKLQSLSDMKSALYEGNTQAFNEAKSRYKKAVEDQQTLGFIDEFEKNELFKELGNEEIAASVGARYLESRVNGTDEEFLSRLANTKPSNLTFDEWQNAISTVLSLKSKQDSLVSQQMKLNESMWLEKIDKNEVQTETELEPAKSELTKQQFFNVKSKLRAKNAKENKQLADILQFETNNLGSPSEANRAKESVKDAAFAQRLMAYTQNMRAETNNPEFVPNIVDKAILARDNYNVPIPSVNAELSYLFKNEANNPEASALALTAFKSIVGDASNPNPSAFKALSMDEKSRQIASLSLFYSEKAGASALDAVARAQNEILKADIDVRAGRLANFNSIYGSVKGTKTLRNMFSDAFGADSQINPTQFNDFQRLFKANAAAMDNVDAALNDTILQLNHVGKSAIGQNTDKLLDFSPEKVGNFMGMNNIIYNQFALAVKDLSDQWQEQQELAKRLPMLEEEAKKRAEEYKNVYNNPDSTDDELQEASRRLNVISSLVNTASIGGGGLPEGMVIWDDKELPEKITENDLVDNMLLFRKGESPDFVDETSLPKTFLKSIFAQQDLPEKEARDFIAESQAKRGGGARPRAKVVINGRLVRKHIFVDGDRSTMTRENQKPTYTMYYEHNGHVIPVNSPSTFGSGVAEFVLHDFAEVAPETFAKMQDTLADRQTEVALRTEYDKNSPRNLALELSPLGLVLQEGARMFNRNVFVREKFEAERQETAKRILGGDNG